jgi:hypothetical protein
MMNKVDRILNSNGKIFTVTFVKKDGSIRVLNGRLGVEKHLKGGQCTLDKDKFIIVYDLKAEGYRAVDKDAILDVVGV